MAEWFVGPIMEKLTEKLIDTCSEYLKDQSRWQTGMKEELKRLQENHPKIQAIVAAASQVHTIDQNPALNKWIWQLRDAIDEADDVLDDFEYMKHEQLLAKNTEETKPSFMSSINKFVERALENDPMLKRLEEVVYKLDKISAEVSTFRDLLKDAKQEQQVQQDELQNHRETGSMPTDVLIGRGQHKEFVIQWLGKLPNEEHQSHVSAIPNMYHNISVLSIVGPGGIGKTTLLQHVYEDASTNVFDPKMWVCVSNSFDSKTVLIDMLESPQNTILDALQKSLKSKVMSKKFLLVLDDIWEEDEVRDKIKWEKVLAPLAYGGLGSKILITTRMNSAASIIAKVVKKRNEPLILKGLEDDECLQLLNTHAFADVENPNYHKKLRSIAQESAKKLFGSPLAAKVMGGVLSSCLDERYWRNVLNNILSYNDIFHILKLSYIFLPEYLQNCFAFCSIFKQDYVFNKEDLVRMWIAVGFIQPSCIREETLEDIGERYFDILVKKSFFDKFSKRYKMHDLLHELAQSVSAQECFRIVGDEVSDLRIPENIRYLSIETDNLVLLKKMSKFKNLRTLCITYDSDNQDLVDVLAKIFEESRSIRLLSIGAYRQEMIPETIECLKHLRYLHLDFSYDTLLPRSVSNLYHLQFLICNYRASHVDLFPRDMNKLSNLRYLRPLHVKFPGIGKLKFLQELNGFEVKNESGYRIKELEYMNDLRILQIEGLENVTDVEEACNAKLCDKRELTDLSLKWKATSQNSVDLRIYESVFDNLQPHENLKKLTIKGYMGVRSAMWMKLNADLISNIECIELEGCLEWQNLPPFGQLPFLKFLRLRNIPKAKIFGNIFHGNGMCCVFPSLEVLYIENLEALVNWFDAGDDCLFPCLTELKLNNCPNLQELPYLPPKLKILKAKNIGWKTLNFCCSILGPFGTFRVFGCPNISTIKMKWEIIGGHGVLTNVELRDCPNLLSIGGLQEVETTENRLNLIVDELNISDASVLQMEPMRSITSVRTLTIEEKDDGAASFPFEAERWFLQVSSSLRELYLKNLKSLQSLPSNLTSLSSLEILHLEKIPLLKSLPDLSSSLREIELRPSKHSAPQIITRPQVSSSLHELYLKNLKSLQSLPSNLTSLSSLEILHLENIPLLKSLPDLPPSLREIELCPSKHSAPQIITRPQVRSSLRELYFENLKSLQSLSSYLTSLSSLERLRLENIPLLKSLPDLPPSLSFLGLQDLDNLNCLPSCLPSLSSLTSFAILKVPQLRELPDLPPSLRELCLYELDNLNCLPSCLPSLSSLTKLFIWKAPQLRELPDLPLSLRELYLYELDNLNCLPSCLPTLSSLTTLSIKKTPQLRELPDLPPSLRELCLYELDNLNCLPSCLPTLSSLTKLEINNVPQLRELPDLPSSLCRLSLEYLENLSCLPSCLPTLSSLTELFIWKAPQLRELPDLPLSLHELKLRNLDNLNCLPSCLTSLSSLNQLTIINVPHLRELPNPPPSLKNLKIEECDPEFMKRYGPPWTRFR